MIQMNQSVLITKVDSLSLRYIQRLINIKLNQGYIAEQLDVYSLMLSMVLHLLLVSMLSS